MYFIFRQRRYFISSGIQTRTTAFSCDHSDNSDYDEIMLLSRSLPWIVRVFFKTRYSTKGQVCSATIIDRYWLVTAKKCCLNKETFQVIFNEKKKSQWLFMGKKRHQKCVKKQFCSKMHPRNDQEIEKKTKYFKSLNSCISFFEHKTCALNGLKGVPTVI